MHTTSSGCSAAREGSNSASRPPHRALFLGCASLLAILAGACGSPTVEVAAEGAAGVGGEGSTASMSGGTGGAGASTASGAGGQAGGTVDACGPIGDLGSIELGELDLKIAKPFTVCDKTVGFAALVTAPTDKDVIGVARLKPPDGGSVLLNFAMANHTNPAFANYGWVLASNPQSNSADSFPVQAGAWRVTLGDDDGSITKASTTVWYRRTDDGLFHGGVVDVNVFLANGAATQNYVSSVLDKMFPFAGIGLGDVQFYPLDGSYSIVSSQDELAKMLQESAGLKAMPVLNLFVIGDFGQAFGDAIGVAGGIPGSPMQHGTGRSGLAYQPSGDATYDASVLRHETGHVAGLFHTTEYSVDETDPLDDTPSCSSKTMQSNPESCPDAGNEMFPIAFGATKFTPHQDLVIQGSMLYRGIVKEGGLPTPPQPVSPPSGASELIAVGPESAADIAQMHLARRPQKSARPAADSLERVLGAVWCAHSGADYTELAVRVAGPSASERLRSLALDETASEFVRARALKGYVRASEKDASPLALRSALDLASSFAQDEGASTDLRVAALRALASHDAPAALSAKAAAQTSTDAVVRAVALDLTIEGPRKSGAQGAHDALDKSPPHTGRGVGKSTPAP